MNKRLNIIITSGLHGNIHIRKSFDFELLTVINYNNNNLIPLQIAVTACNFIYVLYKDKTCLGTNTNKIIYGYTLNGLFFGKSCCYDYIGLEPNERGGIYTGIADKYLLCNINGSLKLSMNKFEFAMFNYGKGGQKGKNEKLKWFSYDVKGNQRFLYYLNSVGELQLIEECYLKVNRNKPVFRDFLLFCNPICVLIYKSLNFVCISTIRATDHNLTVLLNLQAKGFPF